MNTKEALLVPYFKHPQHFILCTAGVLARGSKERSIWILTMVPLICKLVVSFPDHTAREKKKLSQARFLIKKLARGVFVAPRRWKQDETFLRFVPEMPLFQTKPIRTTLHLVYPPPPSKDGSVKQRPHVKMSLMSFSPPDVAPFRLTVAHVTVLQIQVKKNWGQF